MKEYKQMRVVNEKRQLKIQAFESKPLHVCNLSTAHALLHAPKSV